MSVEILAYGPQVDGGIGDPVDVEAHAVLRLDVLLSSAAGANPYVVIAIDSAPTADGPWTECWKRHHSASATNGDNPHQWLGRDRIVLIGFDRYVRARWSGCARENTATPSQGSGFSARQIRAGRETSSLRTAEFTIGISGDGVPAAA